MVRDFFDLEVWRKAHSLTLQIYQVSEAFPREENFGVTAQLRRAATSIGANIAEGYARYGHRDKTKFYIIARASAAETQNFLVVATDLGWLDKGLSGGLIEQIHSIRQMLSALVRSQRLL